MTAAELIDDIERDLSEMGFKPPVRGDLLRRLNREQTRISRELRFPIKYYSEIPATTPFTLPAPMRASSLRSVEHEQLDRSVEVLTVQQANELYPRWEAADFSRKLVIYDPANPSAPITPVGFSSGDTLRILVEVEPTALTEFSSVPFDGLLGEYHLMLAQHVKFTFLLNKGDQRGQAFYHDYMQMMTDAFNVLRHSGAPPRGRPSKGFAR